MFGVNNRKSCKPGNFTKYRIRRDEIIHQLLIPQFQRYRKLQRVKGPQTQVQCVSLYQQVGPRKFGFSD